jgi:uncharacterized iron-regulated membrane protein
MWVSGPCILVAITGVWIGLTRVRAGKRRFKGGRMTPYRGWTKWHHVSGLVGSVFLILWIFSGWLSVDPFRLFARDGISSTTVREYFVAGILPEPDVAELGRIAPDARRVVVRPVPGGALARIERPGADPLLREAATLRPLALDQSRIMAAATRLVPGARIAGTETITRPDAYWYTVRGEVPLPVLRVRYDDAAKTWVYIDPATGELLGQTDSRRRTYRWLFDLFHRWDLNLLLEISPARDLLIWLMSIAGLISSVTAVYIGWLRLRRPRRTVRAQAIGSDL